MRQKLVSRLDDDKAMVIKSRKKVRRRKNSKAFEEGSWTPRPKGKEPVGAFALEVVTRLLARDLSSEDESVVCQDSSSF